MNSTILANKFGLIAAPSGDGGTNYANGGRLRAPRGTQSILPEQRAHGRSRYRTTSPIPSTTTPIPMRVYVIKSGDNDLNFPAGSPPPYSYLINRLLQLASICRALQADGARTIMVPNSYNSARFLPVRMVIIDGYRPLPNTRASTAYRYKNGRTCNAAGVHFIPADIDSVFKYVVHNPTLFGFTSTSMLATNAPAPKQCTSRQNSALRPIPSAPAQQQAYLFVDAVHLTTAGQTIEADYEYSLLIAPSEISLLAESACRTAGPASPRSKGQIDLCGQHRGPCGINVWTSIGACSLQVRERAGLLSVIPAPLSAARGRGLSDVGRDDRGRGVYGGQSDARGSPRAATSIEVNDSPSLYVAYLEGPVWGNAVASYDVFQDKSHAHVQLGIFTDQNNGNTSGQSLRDLRCAAALISGLGPISSGPVAGLVLQQVSVYGFTESGVSGVTALSFADQTRESFVTELGGHVCDGPGQVLAAFAEASWNHECCRQDPHGNGLARPRLRPRLTAWTLRRWPPIGPPHRLAHCYKLSSQVMLQGAASAMFMQSADDKLRRRVGPERRVSDHSSANAPRGRWASSVR